MVLKCGDAEEAKSWERVIAAQIAADESTATFVQPASASALLQPSLFKNVLVVDFGGSSVRAGIACTLPTLPTLFFPAVMAVAHDNEDEKYFGLDAFAPEVRNRYHLIYKKPILRLPHTESKNMPKIHLARIGIMHGRIGRCWHAFPLFS